MLGRMEELLRAILVDTLPPLVVSLSRRNYEVLWVVDAVSRETTQWKSVEWEGLLKKKMN